MAKNNFTVTVLRGGKIVCGAEVSLDLPPDDAGLKPVKTNEQGFVEFPNVKHGKHGIAVTFPDGLEGGVKEVTLPKDQAYWYVVIDTDGLVKQG